jgi:hypothetical protein
MTIVGMALAYDFLDNTTLLRGDDGDDDGGADDGDGGSDNCVVLMAMEAMMTVTYTKIMATRDGEANGCVD